MKSEMQERYELVMSRIEEIARMQDENPKEAFFSFCAKMLSEVPYGICSSIPEQYLIHRYADPAACQEIDEKKGDFYSILYVTMLHIFSLGDSLSMRCILAELLVEMNYTLQEESRISVQDTFYWFFSDYCEIYLPYLFKYKKKIHFGGPFLLHAAENLPLLLNWKEHIFDSCLYIGKRYRERFLQSLQKLLEKGLIFQEELKEEYDRAVSNAASCKASSGQLEILSELILYAAGGDKGRKQL